VLRDATQWDKVVTALAYGYQAAVIASD